jgi:hypothetical protein
MDGDLQFAAAGGGDLIDELLDVFGVEVARRIGSWHIPCGLSKSSNRCETEGEKIMRAIFCMCSISYAFNRLDNTL